MNRQAFTIMLALVSLAFLALLSPSVTPQSGVEYAQMRYRPLIGGIQLHVTDGFTLEHLGYCTLGYAVVERSTGWVGMISAGHCVDFIVGKPRALFQSILDTTNIYYNFIGHPTWVNQSVDMLFVPFSSNPEILYIEGGMPYRVVVHVARRWDWVDRMFQYGPLPACKTGRTTGTTCGYILEARRDCLDGQAVYCLITNVTAWYGDSGSPLYDPEEGFPYTSLYGHLIARCSLQTTDEVINGGPPPPCTIAVSVEGAIENGFDPLTVP